MDLSWYIRLDPDSRATSNHPDTPRSSDKTGSDRSIRSIAVNNTELRDKPRTTREGCLGPGTQPGAARSEGSKWLEAQAHLHTTLNKSRDEKLDQAGRCQSYDFGKRARRMGDENLTCD